MHTQTSCEILLFGSMGDISDAVRKSLKSHGFNVVCVPFPQNVQRDIPGYERELFKAIRQFRPALVMPVGNTLTFSALADNFPDGIKAAVGLKDQVELLDNKLCTYSLAETLGIPQPHRFSSPDEVEEYPVIFKREKSFGGSGVYKPRTRQALENLMFKEPGDRYLIEEYIEGSDFSVDCVTDGTNYHFGAYRSTASRGQGPSILRECVPFPLLDEYAKHILAHIHYKGVCGMDFRVDSSGNAFFLECNPRFTGGISTQIESGFDIPLLLYDVFNS